jgi:hypothetical protein
MKELMVADNHCAGRHHDAVVHEAILGASADPIDALL